jgi:hypothetical protein
LRRTVGRLSTAHTPQGSEEGRGGKGREERERGGGVPEWSFVSLDEMLVFVLLLSSRSLQEIASYSSISLGSESCFPLLRCSSQRSPRRCQHQPDQTLTDDRESKDKREGIEERERERDRHIKSEGE